MKIKLIILSFFTIAYQNTTWAGGYSVGNGGDIVALNFIELTRSAIEKIAPHSKSKEHTAYFKIMLLALNEVTVRSESQLTLNGQSVDAINLPQSKTIILNRERWTYVRSMKYVEQIKLFFHEILGVLNIDDSDYKISSQLVYPEIFNYSEQEDKFISQATPNFDIISISNEFIIFRPYSFHLEVDFYECSLGFEDFKECSDSFVLMTKEKSEIKFLNIRFVTKSGQRSAIQSYLWNSIGYDSL